MDEYQIALQSALRSCWLSQPASVDCILVMMDSFCNRTRARPSRLGPLREPWFKCEMAFVNKLRYACLVKILLPITCGLLIVIRRASNEEQHALHWKVVITGRNRESENEHTCTKIFDGRSLPSKETLRGHSDSSFRGEGYIQCCVGVRLCDMYSNQELAEIHFMYGKADGNAALARRLYQERGRPRSTTPEVQEEILEAVNMTPSISTRRVALQVNVPHTTVWRLLKEYQLYPYHLQRVQALSPANYPARVRFCQWFLQQCGVNPNFPALILFTDEAQFTRDGITNFHNQHVWAYENPRATVPSHHQHYCLRFCAEPGVNMAAAAENAVSGISEQYPVASLEHLSPDSSSVVVLSSSDEFSAGTCGILAIENSACELNFRSMLVIHLSYLGTVYSSGRQHSLKCAMGTRCRSVYTVVQQREIESIPASSYGVHPNALRFPRVEPRTIGNESGGLHSWSLLARDSKGDLRYSAVFGKQYTHTSNFAYIRLLHNAQCRRWSVVTCHYI
ncbi:hypothetical protein ANN_21258 [Periplaneta americana]|uniref:Uncharacterized protein n=1 Tax=Periplaneta americana TaxID=6978 RepID=A0ABQ8SFN5_PERAM|nr:hypothetical protein ANN_21258 [Periplaneta americana]